MCQCSGPCLGILSPCISSGSRVVLGCPALPKPASFFSARIQAHIKDRYCKHLPCHYFGSESILYMCICEHRLYHYRLPILPHPRQQVRLLCFASLLLHQQVQQPSYRHPKSHSRSPTVHDLHQCTSEIDRYRVHQNYFCAIER